MMTQHCFDKHTFSELTSCHSKLYHLQSKLLTDCTTTITKTKATNPISSVMVSAHNEHQHSQKTRPKISIAAPELSEPAAADLEPNREWFADAVASSSVLTKPDSVAPLLIIGYYRHSTVFNYKRVFDIEKSRNTFKILQSFTPRHRFDLYLNKIR